MQWTTSFDIPKSGSAIQYGQRLITLGSCFSEHIGNRLIKAKLHCNSNPFGTLFSPIAIAQTINTSLTNGEANPLHFVNREGNSFHLDVHSSFNAPNVHLLKQKIRNTSIALHENLLNGDWLIVTFGTAHVYRYLKSTAMIANCQKVPQQHFRKEVLNTQEIISVWNELIAELRTHNPQIKIIFTVSPVRHVKDGITENSYSKAILRVACQTLTQENNNCFYFPSYEIMMDELRDYRFYESDMIHPNTQAIDYIWQKFVACYFDQNSIETLASWQKIQTALAHKAFNPDSESHQKFLGLTLEKLISLQNKLELKQEIEQIKKQING